MLKKISTLVLSAAFMATIADKHSIRIETGKDGVARLRPTIRTNVASLTKGNDLKTIEEMAKGVELLNVLPVGEFKLVAGTRGWYVPTALKEGEVADVTISVSEVEVPDAPAAETPTAPAEGEAVAEAAPVVADGTQSAE